MEGTSPRIRPRRDLARRRVQIEGVVPEVDAGRFAVKRVVGDELRVEADVFADGHDLIAVRLLHRPGAEGSWEEVAMHPLGNDRWAGSFVLPRVGEHRYTITAWVDPFLTWVRDLSKWIEAGEDVSLELLEGALLVAGARDRATAEVSGRLVEWEDRLRRWAADPDLPEGPLPDELTHLMSLAPDRRFETRYGRELRVRVDRELARFGAWYEFFPRSAVGEGDRHGTFADAREMLTYVREMGFDVVYLPPIHPIGSTRRKGPNNRTISESGDPGSPWAIGASEGGHTAVHPALGTLADFRTFREAAEAQALDVALDVAFQCSPDHPWVKDHPEWFRHRADGSIRHAENPPKKYEDIFPIDFETEDWEALWVALRDVFTFWMDEGVRIFRVDNPHTKALPFWEWLIGELKRRDPGVILLSEAFTRPRMMYRLAKLGFSQSYTYFAWRNTREELESYMNELTRTEVREYFRPNFWPNTPDILTEYLQTGGRPAFMVRLVLAATLSSSYGIYGPPFELMEASPREPGSEEYLHSEKYEVRSWDLARPDSLRPFIAQVNRIRRENAALQRTGPIRFHPSDNERIIAYSKTDPEEGGVILTVVNLDPHHKQSGWVDLESEALDLSVGKPSSGGLHSVEDLLAGGHYMWEPGRNFVRLDPSVSPAHIFRVSGPGRAESDFEYF
ncbi:MAG: alpha-1,4-glucan--maltose-1-phosphate maltosyltransferase [Gemmatimonadota bacterium]